MSRDKVWFNPRLTEEERRRLEAEDRELIARLKKLPKVKPRWPAEKMAWIPLRPGEPMPETAFDRWKKRRERERKARGEDKT